MSMQTQAVGKLPVCFADADTMSCTAQVLWSQRLRHFGQAQRRDSGAAHSRRREHDHLSQRHTGAGAGGIYGDSLAARTGTAAQETSCRAGVEQSAERAAVRLSGGAHKQSETGDSAYFKFERARRQGRCVSAGAGRQGCLCIRQIRLFRGKYAVQSGVCRQS